MGTLSLAALAAPAFLTKNYLNSDAYNAGGISVLSGPAFVNRAFDMTGTSWNSVGSNDSTTEFYDFYLYDGPTKTPQFVDTIFLWGINAKSFVIHWYYNGSEIASQTVNNYAKSYYLLTLDDGSGNPITIDRVRVEITATQTANAEKTLNMYVGALVLQPSVTTYDYRPARTDSIATIKMADGTVRETAVYRSVSSFEVWSAQLSFRNVTLALRNSLKALKYRRPLVVMPEPGEVPSDIFLARVAPNGYDERYLSIAKAAGYDITLSLEEMGGA